MQGRCKGDVGVLERGLERLWRCRGDVGENRGDVGENRGDVGVLERGLALLCDARLHRRLRLGVLRGGAGAHLVREM